MPISIISVAQMRSWEEAAWAGGQTPGNVIQRVGIAVAARLRELSHPSDAVILVAGKGHNGDDVRAVAAQLKDRHTILISVDDPVAALAEMSRFPEFQSGRAWVVDGLLGIGLDRPVEGGWKSLIDAINASGLPVLSVDVPSGLDAQTGQVMGTAIQAAVTLTVGAPKIGLLTPSAKPFTGRLEVLDEVGLPPCPVSSELKWTLPDDFRNYPPRRPVESNKGTFGHAILYAGSLGYHGAAVLATRGALRAQPGLVSLYTQSDVFEPLADHLFAAMVNQWHLGTPPPKNATAILIGPGLAGTTVPDDAKYETRSLWKTNPHPLIVDASGIDWLMPQAGLENTIRVVTPHPGEAARILGTTPEQIQSNRVDALREISRRFGNAYVVLKGFQTLIGRSTGDIYVNPSGNPRLAQGGSGDLLAGYLTGLLAQPALQKDPMMVLRYGVWQHGAAADHLSRIKPNWTPEDLEQYLGLAQIF
jgi:NAD(P)H-hydrate epimerase